MGNTARLTARGATVERSAIWIFALHRWRSKHRAGNRRRPVIRAEQTKVIYRYLPALILINAVVGAAMVYGLWSIVPASTLVIWACVMTAVLAVRGASYWAYRRHGLADPHCNRSALIFTLGSALSGALWGAAGVLLVPENALAYQLFILFILMGMGAGAVTSLTAYMPAFYAFLPVSLLPISVLLFRENEPIY